MNIQVHFSMYMCQYNMYHIHVGTVRARANHNHASMHYCQEQIDLKLAKAPIT
jgi:hypothetical protein